MVRVTQTATPIAPRIDGAQPLINLSDPDERLDAFTRFCRSACGLTLGDFQQAIAREALDPEVRELLVLLPRGNGKTSLLAALVCFHLLVTRQPEAVVAAASREQASILFNYAARFARHRVLAERLTVRHHRMRTADGGTMLVLPSNGLRQHGLTPTLAVADEVHAWRQDSGALEAMQTSLVKRPEAKLVVISSAGQGDDSALGRLRKRALALADVQRDGALVHARGGGMAALMWELPDDADIDDVDVVKSANPAAWLTTEALARQRQAVPDLAFRRFHCGQWTAREGSWLPAGAFQACVTNPEIHPDEPLWVAMDVGGTQSATALLWCTKDLRVGCWIETAEDAILRAVQRLRELRAEGHQIVEFSYDPWRARQAALELERDRVRCVEFPQTDVRMCPASAALRAAITEKRIQLPSDKILAQHAANAVAAHTRRGWRIASPARGVQVDGIVSLAICVERAQHRPPSARLLGWL